MQGGNNVELTRAFLQRLLTSAFPHLSEQVVARFLQALAAELRLEQLPAFKAVVRDFLIQLKESSRVATGADGPQAGASRSRGEGAQDDWAADDAEAARQREEQQRLADVPGLLYVPPEHATQTLRQHELDM